MKPTGDARACYETQQLKVVMWALAHVGVQVNHASHEPIVLHQETGPLPAA